MPITEILEKNCRLYGNDVCLVEINPEMPETKRTTWKEFELIEPSRTPYYRREITWNVFNEKANRFANLLLERGIQKGDKVGILLMNCLEWLPIYFGILKTGALAVPLNFRYAADEIKYCVELADVDILVFGPEFIGRVEEIADDISKGRLLYYVGDGCPGFLRRLLAHLGLGTGAHTIGELFADLELILADGLIQILLIGVHGNKLYAIHTGIDHTVNNIIAGAADADHLDLYNAIENSFGHSILPPMYLFTVGNIPPAPCFFTHALHSILIFRIGQ